MDGRSRLAMLDKRRLPRYMRSKGLKGFLPVLIFSDD